MKLLSLLIVLVFAPRMLPAQDPAPPQPEAATQPAAPAPPPATGSIAGHVFLGDSHLPARMAYVILLPLGAIEAGDKKTAASTATAQAGLDGSFLMQNVLPGTYYVVAAKLGYASPVPGIDPDDYDRASKEVKKSFATALTPVVVTANRVSTTDIVLSRGAVISGSVRFDDGQPDTQTAISLLRKDKAGKWVEFATVEGFTGAARTDDLGNFRLTGLPAGDYLLRTTLELEGADVSSPGAGRAFDRNYRWDIYLGDGVRPRDAKTITLKDGEESNGNIIEIRLARLHSISGTVLNIETGAPINRADVELHNADDDSICTVTEINPYTSQFHFPYVAEGEYTLTVRNAADAMPDSDPIRTYSGAIQPIIVKGETSGVTIQVKPLPAATAAAQ